MPMSRLPTPAAPSKPTAMRMNSGTARMLPAILIGLAVADWIAAVILVRGALRTRWVALQERAGTAVILAVLASGIAVLAVSRVTGLSLPAPVPQVILSAVLVLLSLPSLLWLIAYLRGRFDGD